jgi:hypothetical protein
MIEDVFEVVSFRIGGGIPIVQMHFFRLAGSTRFGGMAY